MKNAASIFRIIILFAIILCLANQLFANSDEVKDKFEKTFKVSQSDVLELNMYDSDLQINTWNNNEIKLAGEILISGGDKDDIDKILNVFKNPEVTQEAGKIGINTVFSEGSIQIMGFYKKTKLSNGESVSVSSIKSSYTIWIPESIAFKLLSKYNNVKAPNLLGKLTFELYNANLEMGDFGDNSIFDAKYSTIHIGKGQNVKFDIYDCKIFTDELKKVIINSKYSKLTCKAITLLALESYNDEFSIDNLNSIDMSAKYTTLKAKGNSNLGKFDLYDCTIEVEDFTKIEYNSKYTGFTANKVGTFAIETSYNDTYDLKEVSDFSSKEFKYNKVNIGIAQASINLPNTYDSEFKINKVGANFLSFKGDFKYGLVTMIIDPTLNYSLSFENTYGDITFPMERFSKKPTTYIEKDNITKFEGATDPNAKCEINFTSYDLSFTIQ